MLILYFFDRIETYAMESVNVLNEHMLTALIMFKYFYRFLFTLLCKLYVQDDGVLIWVSDHFVIVHLIFNNSVYVFV